MISVRPNCFILMEYLRKMRKISKANPPYLCTKEPPLQKFWISPCKNLGYVGQCQFSDCSWASLDQKAVKHYKVYNIILSPATATLKSERMAAELRINVLKFLTLFTYLTQTKCMGVQWLSGRVLDSRPKGRRFEPHRRHCLVVLEQDTFILA